MPTELTLAIFIDALGWRIQERYGFLEDLLPHRSPLQTVFGYSSTCDPTILTGLPPREHGHFAFFRFAPGCGAFPASWRFLSWLPEGLASRGRVRHWMSRLGQMQLGWDGYFQLYAVPFHHLRDLDYSEKRDIYQPGGILGGQPTFLDSLRAARTPFHLSNWRRGEEHNLARLEEAIAEAKIEFAYLYLAALDGLLHAVGLDDPAIERKVRLYEQQIRRVVEAARRHYNEVRLLIFSDHGMTAVGAHSDLMLRIESLPLRWGRDYGSVFDATMARFWFLDERAERLIRRTLDNEPLGAVVDESELQRWGCDFPGRSYGELFFLLEPGVLFVPSCMGLRPLAAMHGYRPEDPDSVAFFGSSHRPASSPEGLADLAELFLEHAGVPALAGLRASRMREVAA